MKSAEQEDLLCSYGRSDWLCNLGAGLSPIISMDGLIICTCSSMKTLEHMMVPSYPALNSVHAFITESMHAVYSTETV